MSTIKLSCGCEPDASGYGYCPECERKLKAKIWREMSAEKKRFDRYVDPIGSAHLDKIAYEPDGPPSGCSCHINPPCSYCMNKTNEDDTE